MAQEANISPYGPDALQELNSGWDDPTAVARKVADTYGSAEKLCQQLGSNVLRGLPQSELDGGGIETRRAKYGANQISRKPMPSFMSFIKGALEDEMLLVLCASAAIDLGIGMIQSGHEWIDGVAILVAVVIVVLITAINDWSKEKQFRSMDNESQNRDVCLVRGGVQQTAHMSEIVVGDVVLLQVGMTVPADGLLLATTTHQLEAAEGAMTGESVPIEKSTQQPLLLNGTQIVSGEGRMLVTAVGDRTQWGVMMASIDKEREDTPLALKLDVMANQIGKLGMAAATLIFIVMTAKWYYDEDGVYDDVLGFFIIAVTIVVVAVPEGLPLAVTISLAYSMKKMTKDNNFVRHLAAAETMSNVTTICSDKTGTLTQNTMTVSQTIADPKAAHLAHKAIAAVTKSYMDPKSGTLTGGNQTDAALVKHLLKEGVTDDITKTRNQLNIATTFPFSSVTKRSGAVVMEGNRQILCVAGAAEQVLADSAEVVSANAETFTGARRSRFAEPARAALKKRMEEMSSKGLRCIGLAFKEDPGEDGMDKGLTWLGAFCIVDPLRPEVPKAVRDCQNAGIVVRMITGDHLETAKHIARGCNILTNEANQECLTGAAFAKLSEKQMARIMPNLRVLARARPMDKERAVRWYKTNGHIVSVTGDGANDAPALAEANVGLAMGIQGTDVAKEAADIIIMDDNFASIVKTVMWGRAVFDNIRKFLQFQLTVNVVALTFSFVASFFPEMPIPLTSVQMLWINLIMDTMAALALATEEPTEDLLNRLPSKKECSIISPIMWRFVFGHSIFQLTGLFWAMNGAPVFGNDLFQNDAERDCIVFNLFVWFQIFNEINARKVNGEKNVFEGIFGNKVYVAIILFTIGLQIFLVEGLGRVQPELSRTVPLSQFQWIFCVGFASLGLFVNQLLIYLPITNDSQLIDFDFEKEFGSKYAAELKSNTKAKSS